jgi:hypothetical protein
MDGGVDAHRPGEALPFVTGPVETRVECIDLFAWHLREVYMYVSILPCRQRQQQPISFSSSGSGDTRRAFLPLDWRIHWATIHWSRWWCLLVQLNRNRLSSPLNSQRFRSLFQPGSTDWWLFSQQDLVFFNRDKTPRSSTSLYHLS